MATFPIDQIRGLEDSGILSPESCPQLEYWHWQVLKPEELPENLKGIYEEYGEIRWYLEVID